MEKETHEERAGRSVAAAIAFLDEHGPDDWRSRVNVEEINMFSWRRCILGQVYEGQQAGDWDLGIGAFAWASDMLTKADPDGFRKVKEAFANYDAEWKRQLGGEPQLGGAA